jgi:hypothetical protein
MPDSLQLSLGRAKEGNAIGKRKSKSGFNCLKSFTSKVGAGYYAFINTIGR